MMYREPTKEEKEAMLEQQRAMMIENFRQMVAQQCATAMCVKLDDEHIDAVHVARRAKKIADALVIEMFEK